MNKGWDCRPNRPETFLKTILNEYWPGQWKYTGDFSFMINGKNPDFVNEEQKLVIEFYGDYWYKGDNPVDREEIFAQSGYETMIIWEHELNNELDNVLYKLKLLNDVGINPIQISDSPESAILMG